MTNEAPPAREKMGSGFKIGLGVLAAVLAAGLYFAYQLTTFSPEEVRQADLIQREAKAWKQLQAELDKPHTRQDEIGAYEDFLKRFPPGNPPAQHEADAQKALATINAERAPAAPAP